MKLLFLANRMPYPPYRGDKLKIYNIAKRLAERHELHLLTFAQTPEDLTYIDHLSPYFKEIETVYLPKWRSAVNCLAGLWNRLPLQVLYFQHPQMKKLLAERLKRHTYNGVHVQHLRMSPYMLPYSNIPAILDLPDAFSLYWERRKTVKRGLLTQIFENEEQKRVLAYEGILKKYALALACSQEDIDYLQAKHHANNLLLLPNGVDTNTFAPANHSYAHNNTLLFTGNMDYAPNVDAVVYFVQQILPFIQAQYPDVTFIIAGQKPVKKVLELANDKVKVTGFVKNLAEVYNSASVVVAPLRFGAGTQNKVLEAMAMGIPVVCSHIGFKGLGVASGEGVIMQQQPEAFAQAVCQLLHSAAYREEVGKKGIAIIQSRFNWNAIATLLEGYFRRIG